MKLNQKLNLVVDAAMADGSAAYVHAMPISQEVFRANFLVVAKTFAAIYEDGLGRTAGPRVAAMQLERIARDAGVWDGPGGAEQSLMNEIRRLANVIAPGPKGWETYPYQEAVDKGLIDPDSASEVENAIVFFIVASAMHRRATLGPILEGVSGLWGAQTSPSSSTEFAASLPTSTETAPSGVTVGSQVPS